jgi:hypothetical protein
MQRLWRVADLYHRRQNQSLIRSNELVNRRDAPGGIFAVQNLALPPGFSEPRIDTNPASEG